MLDSWRLFRGVFYPVTFENDVLAAEKFFTPESDKIDGVKSVGKMLSVSLCERFASEDDRHTYGLDGSRRMNDSLKSRKGRELTSEEVRVYLGFYELTLTGLCGLKWSYHTVTVFWDEEDGNDRHYTIEVRPNGMPIPRTAEGNPVKREFRDIVRFLTQLASGPFQFQPDNSTQSLAQSLMLHLPELPSKVA